MLRRIVPNIFKSLFLSLPFFFFAAFLFEVFPTHLLELVLEYGLSNELLSYLYGGRFSAFVKYPCPTINCLSVLFMPVHVLILTVLGTTIAMRWYWTSEVRRFNDLFDLRTDESKPNRKYKYAGGIFLFIFLQAFIHLLIYGVNLYYEDEVKSLGVLFSHLFDGKRVYFIPLHLLSGVVFGYGVMRVGLKLEEDRIREETRRAMIEQSQNPMFVLRGNRIDYANNAFHKLLGSDSSENFDEIKDSLPAHKLEEKFQDVFVGKVGAEVNVERINIQSTAFRDLLKSVSFLLLVCTLVVGSLLYQAGFLDPRYATQGVLYVGNELNDISIVDAATNKEMSKLPAGDHVSAMAVSGRYLFAAMVGHHHGRGPACQCLNQLAVNELRMNSIWVYDLEKRKVVVSLPTGKYPADIEIAGDYLLVSNAGLDTLLVIDVSTYKLVKSLKVGNNPQGIAVAGNYAYVVNSELSADSGTISVVDLRSLEEVSRIPVGRNPVDVVISRNVGYVSCSDAIYALKLDEGRVSEIMKIGGKLTKLAIAPSGLYAIDALDRDVKVIGKQGRINVGGEPKDLAITHDGRLLYVATENSVVVVDTPSGKVLKRIPITRLPFSLKFYIM